MQFEHDKEMLSRLQSSLLDGNEKSGQWASTILWDKEIEK